MGTICSKYLEAYNNAVDMMNEFDGLEPTSAFKQAASDVGIPEGEEMKKFCEFATEMLLS